MKNLLKKRILLFSLFILAFPSFSENLPAENKSQEHSDIPLVSVPDSSRPEVDSFRQQYMQPKWIKLLGEYLETALPYRLYVRKELKEKNLPFYLEYLPVVESNYNPRAKSRSGALGMWQFMENSVYPFLTLNEYVDERLDPWKSTDAALKKLRDNYNIFGDWNLAIGAYNCGAGAMAKALKKSSKKDYWHLCENNLLSRQTSDYVPKLLAIADLVENCEAYGVSLPKHHDEYELLEIEKQAAFDYITVEAAYSIKQLAQEMRIDSDELIRLNPSYIKGFTLPEGKSEIRLPLGMAQSAKDALSSIEPIDLPFKYTVKKGDSLWSISRTYGVSVKSLCEINDISENAILRIGKILYIPSK